MSNKKSNIRKLWLQLRKFIPESLLVMATEQLEKQNFHKTRQLYRTRGFYPATSPKAFLYWLDDQDISQKENELKTLTNLVRFSNNQAFYEQVLTHFIKDWKVDIISSSYIGEGQGSGSFNVYRKVSIDEEDYFEKVYFNSSRDLKTVLWFDEHIASILSPQIKLPRIQKHFSGDIISLLYFDFLDLKEEEYSGFNQLAFDYCKILYKASHTHKNYLNSLDIPSYLKDFTQHYQYKRNLATVKELSPQHHIDYLVLEKAAKNSANILTHADLHDENIFAENTLIDWDHFGFYPIGFEVAFSFFRILETHRYDKELQLTEWLEQNFRKTISSEDWVDFERNFFYFLYVFAIKRIEKNQLENTSSIVGQIGMRLKSQG